MEFLNHFVAARLMTDAQLFERIGRYDGTQTLLGRAQLPASRVDNARESLLWMRPANDDARTQRSD